MKPVSLGNPPHTSLEAKVDWCISALQQIQRASRDADPGKIFDQFTITNLTEDRTLDADSTTLAEVADVLGTVIKDFKSRGSKRST